MNNTKEKPKVIKVRKKRSRVGLPKYEVSPRTKEVLKRNEKMIEEYKEKRA
nr:type II toxin-antitoxin system SpoIISB family antitoxin [Alkalihalobacterium alkalinitrilicum]